MEPAAEALGVEGDWKALRSQVVVRLVPRTLLLEVKAQAGSPSEAELIADEVSRQLVAFTAGLSPFRQVQVEPARADLAPVSPNVRMNTLLAGALGFLAASAVAVVAELTRRRRRETFASTGSLEQLGEIDLREEMAASTTPIGGPDGATAAVDRAALIVGHLRVVRRHSPLRTVAIVGPASLTVRPRVTAYLAIGLSQDGSKTVLVDLDLQQPTQHRLCGVDGAQGVAEMLASRGSRIGDTLKQTSLPALRVLPAGGPPINSKLLLSPAGLDRIVQGLLKTAEVVVFDLPIGDRVAEVVLLGELVDAVVLVVPRRRLRRTDRRLVEDLARAGVELAGIVTVRSPLLTRFGSDEIPRRPILESLNEEPPRAGVARGRDPDVFPARGRTEQVMTELDLDAEAEPAVDAGPDTADDSEPGLGPSADEETMAAPRGSSAPDAADR